MDGTKGTGTKVGVIDSGVHVGHPHINGVAGGVSIDRDGRIADQEFTDLLGHGTAVMAAIQEKAPEAEYYAVRVFERELRTSARALEAALDWCFSNAMDAVNLSLGTTNEAHRRMFEDAAQRAETQGTVVFAAREADGIPCFPGSLPGVVGVEVDWECPRDSCTSRMVDGQLVLRASGYPRPAPGVPLRRNLHGISFATANACGILVGSGRLREMMPACWRRAGTGGAA